MSRREKEGLKSSRDKNARAVVGRGEKSLLTCFTASSVLGFELRLLSTNLGREKEKKKSAKT